ncbi:MAG: hypothetical protein RLZZ519_2570 [Bacteroidota bacterium]
MKVIKSEGEYQVALKRLKEIFFAEENTPECDEAELLVLLIENYEELQDPFFSLNKDDGAPQEIPREIMSEIQLSRAEIAEGQCKSHEEVMESAKTLVINNFGNNS